MPPALLNAYLDELGRLEAREHLATMAVVQAATGGMKPEARKALVTGLQRAAGSRGPRARRPADQAELARSAASMGIGLVEG